MENGRKRRLCRAGTKIQERESLIAREVLRVHVRACQRFTFYTENYAHLSTSYSSFRMLFNPVMYLN